MKESDHAQEALLSEEIIAKLREAEVLLGRGQKVAEIVKTLGVHEVTSRSPNPAHKCLTSALHGRRAEPYETPDMSHAQDGRL